MDPLSASSLLRARDACELHALAVEHQFEIACSVLEHERLVAAFDQGVIHELQRDIARLTALIDD